MIFIFPKNYNYKLKLFGCISYSTALINVIIGVIIFKMVNFIFNSFSLKVYFFIGLYLPVFLFSILGNNKENFINVIKYIIKFFINRKVYVYRK